MKHFVQAAFFAAVLASPAAAEDFVVTMVGSNYSPSSISASIGDTIRFVNDDGTDHNVFVPTTSHALDLGKQEPGSEIDLVLRTPGNFDVECVFHAHMLLKVEVSS